MSKPTKCAPLVSVVIASYNAAATLDQTIESVLCQTIANIEVVVVDDGSSDGTPDLVRELMGTDRRIRLIEQRNAGPSSARNRGVELARAETIAFIDADDLWKPDHLALNLANLDADKQLGASFSACEIIDLHGRSTGEKTRVSASQPHPRRHIGVQPDGHLFIFGRAPQRVSRCRPNAIGHDPRRGPGMVVPGCPLQLAGTRYRQPHCALSYEPQRPLGKH